MTISTLFFIFLAMMVVGILAVFINFIIAARKMGNGVDIGSVFGNMFIVHLVFGFFYVIGGLGSLITGVIWIIHAIKATT
jgi:hypothetical protein